MHPRPAITAYIALGANLGDREANIHAALDLLNQTPDVQAVQASSLLDNPAVGGPADSPPYLNAAARVQTTLAARPLLHRMLEIEKLLGRSRRHKWEPRPIDLDLLLYGDQIISSQELIVPHPLMHERRFVLQPLAEIAPDAIHPILQIPIAALLANLTRK